MDWSEHIRAIESKSEQDRRAIVEYVRGRKWRYILSTSGIVVLAVYVIARVAMGAPEYLWAVLEIGLLFVLLMLFVVWSTPMKMWTETTRDVTRMKNALLRRQGLRNEEQPWNLWDMIRHAPPLSWIPGIAGMWCAVATVLASVTTGELSEMYVMGFFWNAFLFITLSGAAPHEERAKIEKAYREQVPGVMELRGALGEAEAKGGSLEIKAERSAEEGEGVVLGLEDEQEREEFEEAVDVKR